MVQRLGFGFLPVLGEEPPQAHGSRFGGVGLSGLERRVNFFLRFRTPPKIQVKFFFPEP